MLRSCNESSRRAQEHISMEVRASHSHLAHCASVDWKNAVIWKSLAHFKLRGLDAQIVPL
jgi:hypothetical protein